MSTFPCTVRPGGASLASPTKGRWILRDVERSLTCLRCFHRGGRRQEASSRRARDPRHQESQGFLCSLLLRVYLWGSMASVTPHMHFLPPGNIPQVFGETSVLYARPDYHLLLFSGGQEHSSVITVGCPCLNDTLVLERSVAI